MKAPFGPALQLSTNVLGEDFRFSQGKLSGARTGLPRLRIGYRGAIAQGPQAGTARQPKRVVHNQGTALVFFDGKRIQEWIRRRPGGPYKRLGLDFTVAQDDDAGTHVR